MNRIATIRLVLCIAFSSAAYAATVTPDGVLCHIARVGAKQTLTDYYDKPEWMTIKRGIASGEASWLKIYSDLKSVADAGAGEDLGDAIFEALPRRPFEVIPLLTSGGEYTVKQICTFTFESQVPAQGTRQYLNELKRSLRKARTTDQLKIAHDCREGMELTRKP